LHLLIIAKNTRNKKFNKYLKIEIK